MRIATWVGYRLIGALIVLWLVATAIFVAVRMVPGDPAEAIMGGPGSQASAEALAAARAQYGLDLPILEQYWIFLTDLAVGNFGNSYALKQPVVQILTERFPATLQLALVALVLGWILAFILAALASRSTRFGNFVGTLIEVVAAAIPHFWLGSVLIIIFSTWLGILPSIHNNQLSGLILPALTLAIPIAGFLAQLMRDSLTAAMGSNFALAARTRGATEWQVFFRHGFRHAALPALNLTGWAFASLISGAVVVEEVFARPGIGRTLLSAVIARDIPMVTGVAIISALVFMIVMFVVEAVQQLINPAVAGGEKE